MGFEINTGIFYICVTLLIILCTGEPDLLDALVAYFSK